MNDAAAVHTAINLTNVMAIPSLNEHGVLPEGVHNCSLVEVEERFGQFQHSDRRCRLFERLRDYMHAAKSTGLISAVIIDGSFVTDKDEPSDIDLILVVRPGHDFSAELRPREYNVLSRQRIRRQFRFDALVGEDGQIELDEHIRFFSQLRGRELKKGMLRVNL